jgi:hypothetical protein
MDKLTFKEWSTISDLQTIMPLGEDQEFSMARGELKTAQAAITRLMTKLKGEGDLEAWVQSKITKAAEYLDTVSDHLTHGEDDTKRIKEEEDSIEEAVLGRYKEDRGGGKKLRPSSERLKPKEKQKKEPTGPKITILKRKGPRKGEATASQVQGWRGSDRTNTNRKGHDSHAKSYRDVKESYEFSNWRDEFKPTEYETVDIIETTPLKETEEIRYCPKCKKNEKKGECKYGESYWKMFSLPKSLSGGGSYDPNEVHPANEGVSFEIGSGHKKAQKQAKIRNLATGTNNPNEKSNALRRLSGPSLPLADSVIQPGQLTNEDYQRIQSTGNVYTILFSWRGRSMMSLQLFFPNMKRPSKDDVKKEIEKFYPGAVIMQWYPSPTDPSKPIVVIQR